MKNRKLKDMCLSGIFCAFIFCFTAYLHIPSHTGYTHIGDGFIFLAASLLPLSYAVFASSLGAALADCLTGFAVWAPGTLIIKALTAMLFTCKTTKIISKRNTLALFLSALLCSVGYYIYESVLVGNFISSLAGIPGYLTQSVLSSILYIAFGLSLDKLNFKNMIYGEKL